MTAYLLNPTLALDVATADAHAEADRRFDVELRAADARHLRQLKAACAADRAARSRAYSRRDPDAALARAEAKFDRAFDESLAIYQAARRRAVVEHRRAVAAARAGAAEGVEALVATTTGRFVN